MTELADLRQQLAALAALPAAAAADAARADQERRWAAGELVSAEVYLAALPAVAADPEQALIVIYGEVLARAARGEAPQLAEYRSRFPRLADRLALQFDVHDALAGGTATDVYTAPVSAGTSGSELSWTRFAPGELVASRYRVVAALGRGGMGEVWRADDLTLGVTVALKFLPFHLADDPSRLARFRKEVTVARRVSHPNCCRVYDLAEHAGQPFLTMEYIDGENLSSALRRFGRLPEERAVTVAQELCQALHAVHEQGLLHCDLKPDNVMLDGRGKVRLTDFGLATAVEDLGATALRSGTPAYMAPEQLAGREVTARSDLFALGMVLYELFTGKKAFAGADRSTPPSRPSSHVPGLEAAVERAILRCLEPEPRDRPSSALAVAAALPGGDPLAAALAAGETPSPQLVADAPIDGRLRPAVALGLLASVLLGILGLAALNGRVQLAQLLPPVLPPEELAAQARAITRSLGDTDPPADSVGQIAVDRRATRDWQRRRPPQLPVPGEAPVRPALVYYWHRESPQRLVNLLSPAGHVLKPSGIIAPFEPWMYIPGMTTAYLDLTGRLIEFHAAPIPDPTGAKSAPGWWTPLFAAAGLDERQFQESQALARLPRAYADDHRAWEGITAEAPDMPMRVEAAAYRGRPVYARIGPSGDTGSDRTADSWAAFTALTWHADPIELTVAVVAGTIGVVFARRNLRSGRANVRGAIRLGTSAIAAFLLSWLLVVRHTSVVRDVIALATVAVGKGALLAGYLGLLYLAVEPAVRRRWPHRVVGWNRLLEGRLRDPLVGRDALIGGVAALTAVLMWQLRPLVAVAAGVAPPLAGLTLEGVSDPLGHLVLGLPAALLLALNTFFVFFVLARVLRREWAAAVVAVAVLGTPVQSGPLAWLDMPTAALVMAVTILLILRFGLLPMFFGYLFGGMLLGTPVTLSFGAWYGPAGLLYMLAAAALAGYGFIVSLGGQPLFGGGVFGDD